MESWKGKWDAPPRPGRWKLVDAHQGRLHHKAQNAAAVKFYERNPYGHFDSSSGEPYLANDGVWYNGNHRVQAGRNVGRKVWAWVEF